MSASPTPVGCQTVPGQCLPWPSTARTADLCGSIFYTKMPSGLRVTPHEGQEKVSIT